jgi:alpha-beta hydrolase superfamily lysophospholipase
MQFRRLVAIAVASLTLATGCATLDTWQRKMIFAPDAYNEWVRYGAREAPAGTKEYDLVLANGDRVHTWYLRGDDTEAPTVLFLHGARRNLYTSVSRIEYLHELGFHVLAIDYRGFGKSTTLLPSEKTAIEDTRAAFEELKRLEPDPGKRFVYGYSLGGALAIDLAADVDDFAGLVVESSFTRISDIVRASKWGWVPFVSLLVTQKFDSLERIAQVNEPLLLLHGTDDFLLPHVMADQLYAAAKLVAPERKRVIKIDGAGHRGVLSVGGTGLREPMREFVATARQTTTAAVPTSAAAAAR